MWRYIIAIPLIAHGLAHISGFVAAWTAANAGYAINRPWIFSDKIIYKSAAGRAFGLLWLVAAIGLLGTCIAILLGSVRWVTLAIASAIISLATILPWWNTIPPGARIGALFDITILVVSVTPLKDEIISLISN